MYVVALLLTLALGMPQGVFAQPVQFDTLLVLSPGDTNRFWVQIPEDYNPDQPPPILVWWHQFGSDRHELLGSGWATTINARGWIAACHTGGPVNSHWNTRIAQNHVRTMLDWIMENYSFSRDSIYMMGSSMGGAGGFIWHDNNCGISDYLLAAAAGGSPILDCELRQTQYVDSGHVNNSMITAFGGLPWDSDSVAFEYRRYSAVCLADTSQSMHYNALHLPAYVRWGTSDSTWSAEWFAYGRPAQHWDTLRQVDGAETTFAICSGLSGHGYVVMRADSVLDWLSGFSVNRFPTGISINADEADEYYWTRVTLRDTAHVFGRYGVTRDFDHRRLNINLIRNIDTLDVEFAFPWAQYDSLRGIWLNRDSVNIPMVTVRLTQLPTPVTALTRNGTPFPFAFADSTFTAVVPPSGNYGLSFDLYADDQPNAMPRELKLVSAYPNPFNSRLTLDISSNLSAREVIRLYDVTGRLARSLSVDLSPGLHHVPLAWDGLASGIYFVTMSGTSQRPLKIMLLK